MKKGGGAKITKKVSLKFLVSACSANKSSWESGMLMFHLLFLYSSMLVAEKVIDSICYQTKARPNQYQVHVKIPPSWDFGSCRVKKGEHGRLGQ